MKNLITIIFFVCAMNVNAQEFTTAATFELAGIFSSETENPFWFYTNTNTEIGNESSLSGIASISSAFYFQEENFIEVGLTGMYRNEVNTEFQRRDLHVSYTNRWLHAVVGAKKQKEVFKGLSSTNKNFLFSGNARPLGGVLLEASKPISISENFGVDWGIGHYQLNDDRYVEDVRVHYKRLGVVFKFNNENTLTARIQHYAQWAGKSPVLGQLEDDFTAFKNVFLAQRSSVESDDGESQNALGNHLGTYFFEYSFNTTIGQFETYHEHPFEDGSGTRFANFPDGVWGVTFQPKNKAVVSHILYEYVTTTDQSGDTSSVSGADGYFGNNIYRSGWTYERSIIGNPFILIDRNRELTDTNSLKISDRSKVHHFGLAGTVKGIDWTVKSSIATFLGTYRQPLEPNVNSWFNYISAAYVTEQYGVFKVFAGADLGDGSSVVGGGLTYKYIF